MRYYRGLVLKTVYRWWLAVILKPGGGGRPISVIVPVYNHYEYLSACLDSVLSQKNAPVYELIVINDASPDKRVDGLLKKYARQHPETITYISHGQNQGIAKTQNEAIAAARFDYIAFLDCDDYLNDNALAVAGRFLRRYPGRDYYFSDRFLVDGQNRLIRKTIYGDRPDLISFSSRGHAFNLYYATVASHLKVIKKSAIIDAGMFATDATSGAQDYDLALRIADHGSFMYMPYDLYVHRFHQNSVTASQASQQVVRAATVLRKTLVRRFGQRRPELDPAEVKQGCPVKKLVELWQSQKNDIRCEVNAGNLYWFVERSAFVSRVKISKEARGKIDSEFPGLIEALGL